MASSATRWVRWRIKVKAHVLAPHLSVHRMLWVVVGRRRRPRGKRPGRASGGRPAALHVTDDTALTCEPNQAGLARAVSSIPTTPGRYHAAAHVRSTGSKRARSRKRVHVLPPVHGIRCSGHKRDLRDPSPALLDGCNGLMTRSLNDPRQCCPSDPFNPHRRIRHLPTANIDSRSKS
jgi:hypothetical protein